MKLTIFGATGRTGQHLLAMALEAGHDVTALVRSPAKLSPAGAHLTVVQGDITNAAQVDRAVAGSEAVISVLGPASNKPEFTVSRGMEHIIAAMEKHGPRRLVVSAGAGVPDPHDEPKLFDKIIGFLLRTFSGNVYEDMLRMVTAVRHSDLDWTIVRVPMLTDNPPQGSIKVAYVGKGLGSRITRADMAAFMLQQLQDDSYIQQAPAISN